MINHNEEGWSSLCQCIPFQDCMTASDQEDGHTESSPSSAPDFYVAFMLKKKGKKIIRSPPLEDGYVSSWRYEENLPLPIWGHIWAQLCARKAISSCIC